MKWAKTTKELKQLTKNMSPQQIKACFTEYDLVTTVDPTAPITKGIKSKKSTTRAFGVRKNPGKPFSMTTFHKWTFHRNLRPMSQKARRKYEIFCGGFLYFYDHQILSHKNGKDVGKGYLYDLKKDHNIDVEPILAYFRTKLSDGLLDHEMWFNWEKDPKHENRWQVTIYLNPAPGNPDPPSTPPPPPPEDSFA